MKIVFFGTPEFAVPTLEKLIQSNHDIIAVVTSPDKERGRGRKVSSTPVKEFAIKKNLYILTPKALNDLSFVDAIKSLNADLFIVVAFRILPKEVYTLPKYGAFNLHGSLLPKYRGAAPIQWALINGETETGLTTFMLEEKVDSGNIILQEKIEIDDDDNFGSLHDKMMNLGSELVLETVSLIESQTYQLKDQDISQISLAPKITKETCQIDWRKSATDIHNLVRGLSPYPGANSNFSGINYKIFRTNVLHQSGSTFMNEKEIGEPFVLDKDKIFVKTISGILQILEIQPEGRKRMTAEEFLRGYKFEP
jgi:methionyl-tRNA formyltransferase